ncbi:MAG: 2-hydroxyacyl-CoA dehydratase [Candidatus Tectomicrobia bacterium]|uniref:2-hydroxyacyl-CoA dehydratase n=1 Tax=Tectimicrobiota bacterium TaxID=2528274 RepID=A0A932G1S1_UNCTE|nr:2-hydroxyacyl-CoA dehydratase [Candidatus Tectomicrobia bacterium]
MPDEPITLREPARTPFERGVPLGSREELVRAYAAWHVQDYVIFRCFLSPQAKNHQLLQMMRQWKAEGMVMHLNRGCEGTAFGQMENRRALLQAGYPVVTYEGNMSDRRELDEAQPLDRLEAFLQSLGLKKLD